LEIPNFRFRDFISSEEMENFILSSARLRSSASPSSYFTCSNVDTVINHWVSTISNSDNGWKIEWQKNKHQLYLASDTLKIKNIYENTEGIQA
jgi:hypothetical protein